MESILSYLVLPPQDLVIGEEVTREPVGCKVKRSRRKYVRRM